MENHPASQFCKPYLLTLVTALSSYLGGSPCMQSSHRNTLWVERRH